MIRELTELRSQIDNIDKALLDLLVQRMMLVTAIGEIKNQHGLPIYVPERENVILAARRKEAQSIGISPDLIEDVLRRIMRESYISEDGKVSKSLSNLVSSGDRW